VQEADEPPFGQKGRAVAVGLFSEHDDARVADGFAKRCKVVEVLVARVDRAQRSGVLGEPGDAARADRGIEAGRESHRGDSQTGAGGRKCGGTRQKGASIQHTAHRSRNPLRCSRMSGDTSDYPVAGWRDVMVITATTLLGGASSRCTRCGHLGAMASQCQAYSVEQQGRLSA
jgi:hypothetical protein